MQNKIARIHVNQHVIKANAKYGENNPVFTIKQGGKNTYAYNVKVVGEMELVYSPDKPLSCGAKVWIETRGDIELDGKRDDTKDLTNDKLSDTKCYKFDKIDRKVLQELADFKKELFPNSIKNKDFLIRKQRKLRNKNKLSACLSR